MNYSANYLNKIKWKMYTNLNLSLRHLHSFGMNAIFNLNVPTSLATCCIWVVSTFYVLFLNPVEFFSRPSPCGSTTIISRVQSPWHSCSFQIVSFNGYIQLRLSEKLCFNKINTCTIHTCIFHSLPLWKHWFRLRYRWMYRMWLRIHNPDLRNYVPYTA